MQRYLSIVIDELFSISKVNLYKINPISANLLVLLFEYYVRSFVLVHEECKKKSIAFTQDFLIDARRTPERGEEHTSVCDKLSDKCNEAASKKDQ